MRLSSLLLFPALEFNAKKRRRSIKNCLRKSIEKRTNHNAQISANQICGSSPDFPNQEILNAWFQRPTIQHYSVQCAIYSHYQKANTESCTTQHSLPLGTFLFSFSGLKQTNTGQYPCTRLSTASCSSSQIVYTYRVVTSYLT